MPGQPEWASILVMLRHGRGWSQMDLARSLQSEARKADAPSSVAGIERGSIVRSINRWENEGVKPDARYQRLLSRVYANRGGRTTVGPGSEFEQLLSAFEIMGVPMERREWLRATVTVAAAAGSDLIVAFMPADLRDRLSHAIYSPAKVDIQTLRVIEDSVIRLREARDSVHNLDLLLSLSHHTYALRELLRAQQPAPIREKLCSIAVQAFGTAARYSWGIRDFARAKRYYEEAVAAGKDLQDGWPLALVLVEQSFMAFYGLNRMDLAINLVTRSEKLAQNCSSSLVRYRVNYVLASTLAAQGDRSRVERAISVARRNAQQVTNHDPASYFLKEARKGPSAVIVRVDGHEGLSALRLGATERAASILQRAILVPTGSGRHRACMTSDLAIAQAKMGQPEAAAKNLADAAEVVARTNGFVSMKRLLKARHALVPWQGEQFVKDLDEQLHGAGII